jgi:hypothetical protein
VLDIARELGNIGQLSVLLGCSRLRRPAVVSGLWSVNNVNRRLSSMKRKWPIAWKQASSSLSKAECFTCELSSFLEKNRVAAKGPPAAAAAAKRRRCDQLKHPP